MSTIYESEEEVREAIIGAFDQSTGRGDFLRTILGVGAGITAMGVGGSLLSGGQADAASLGLDSRRNRAGVPQSDIDILNYALTLEHIEATFYRNVKSSDAPTRQVAEYVKIVANHEKAHVITLTSVINSLGGKPVKEARYRFPKFSLPFGITVENLGVQAYLGQVGLIKTASLLAAAASIVTVEARHAAAWASLYQAMDFTQGSFDSGLNKSTVVGKVTPFFAM